MNDIESHEERAEKLGAEIEARIKGGKLNLDQVELFLNPDFKAHHVKLACNSFGYNACTFSGEKVISLDRKDGSPSLCLGSRVRIVAVGGRVRGFGSSMILSGNELGVITGFRVIPPPNPTGQHSVTVSLEDERVVRVFPNSVELV